jgi:REP-associated tyrosine transposase
MQKTSEEVFFMSRPLRIEYEGALYHVTSRGNERKDIFYSDRDKLKYLEILEAAYKRFKIIIHAYCLMTNHYHLLIETTKANLSKCMQYINSVYTGYFNKKRKRCGHLFQGRYLGILVEEDSYLTKVSRYIHLNPVRAKIAKRPEDFEWSSYGYFVNEGEERPIFLDTEKTLSYFDNDIRNYRGFVDEGLVEDVGNPFVEAFANMILGEKEFIERIKKEYVDNDKKQRDLPDLRKIRTECIGPELILEGTSSMCIDLSIKEKKKLEAYFLRTYTDYSLEEISANYIVDKSASSLSNIHRRFEADLKRDVELQHLVSELTRKMCSGEV